MADVKTPFNDEELDHFKNLLQEKRIEARENLQNLQEAQADLADADDEDASSMDHHIGDWASDEQDSDRNYRLIERTQEYIKNIDDALDRIENKTYGLCLATQKPISRERLESVPHTRYSMEAKEQGLTSD